MLICDQKWREAMTGSISLYDKHGERLHTIYVGAAPEYGRETFFNRMTREIDHVKSLYPLALFAGIADGAKSNWDFLGPHIDEQVLISNTASRNLAGPAWGITRKNKNGNGWFDDQGKNPNQKPHAARRIRRNW